MLAKQADGAMSTVQCEGRGIKRKLDSIHAMHSTLHEDQDESSPPQPRPSQQQQQQQQQQQPQQQQRSAESKDDPTGTKEARLFTVGEVVWGCARGSAAWPGKVEALGPSTTTLAQPTANQPNRPTTVWIRWYGEQRAAGLSQVAVKSLKSLSEGLEAHHRARKKFRKSRKLNTQLENAIQEAMAELDSKSSLAVSSSTTTLTTTATTCLTAKPTVAAIQTIRSRPVKSIAPAPHPKPQQPPVTRTIGLRKTPGRKVPQVTLVAVATPRANT